MTGTELSALVRGMVHDEDSPQNVDEPWMIRATNMALEWVRSNAPEALMSADGRRLPFLRISALEATLCVPDPYQVPMSLHMAMEYHRRDGRDEAQQKLAQQFEGQLMAWLRGGVG